MTGRIVIHRSGYNPETDRHLKDPTLEWALAAAQWGAPGIPIAILVECRWFWDPIWIGCRP